jgi:hypothetical protein
MTMRFDVHKVRTYLVNELNEATSTIAGVRHDGTDIVLVDLITGESVMIYLIERLLPVNEIKDILNESTGKNIHTLFVLWADMLLPQENSTYLPEEWMEALLTLYNGKIYGYESYGPYASVFPVYFKPTTGFEYFVTYGDAILASNLHCDYVHVDTRFLKGFWRVADFAEIAYGSTSSEPKAGKQRVPLNPQRNSLNAYFEVLELRPDADREAVRRAYYRLARNYHPDVSTSPDSTARMQQINEAYQRIMSLLDKDD